MYLKTLEKIPQALKEFKNRVVTRGDPTGSLAYYYVTRDLVEEHVQGTYGEENINARKHSLC
jgi:hypothetical protein